VGLHEEEVSGKAEETMLGNVQESISSPLHMRKPRCMSARSPLEEVPVLCPHEASQGGVCHENVYIVPSIIAVLHLPCTPRGLKHMQGRTRLLRSRAELDELGGCVAQG